LKYKSKYYLKKNSILEENDNFNGSIDLINQKGGVEIRDLYKKYWWHKNSKLKTGPFRIGIGANNSIRQNDIEKLQFIEYIIDLCDNTPINDAVFTCTWENGDQGTIRRVFHNWSPLGVQQFTLLYGPSNQPVNDLYDNPILVRRPEPVPKTVGQLVKFTAIPLVQGHGGGSDFTCFGTIAPDSNIYDYTLRLIIDWQNPIFDQEIRNRSMFGMPGESDRVKNTRTLNTILAGNSLQNTGLGYSQNTPYVYVDNRSWYDTHRSAFASKGNSLLADNEGSYRVIQNPI
jgi:hypothetical protein